MTAPPEAKHAPLPRRLLLVTGKGGIGKSLVAAALAQAAAAAGRRTLLVESAAVDQLAPLFGREPGGHRTINLAPGLDGLNISAPENFRDYVVKHLGQRALFDKVFSNRVVQSFINTIPGLAEVMLLGRLYYECELAPAPRYDLVVFDGPASGHFLSLMTTPAALLGSNLGGPLARETERVRDFLADSRACGVIYVTVPEDLVISECLDFLPQLAGRSPARVCGVVVNRMPVSAEAAVHLDAPAGGPAAAWLARRERTARRAMATLREGIEEMKVTGGRDLPLWVLSELGAVREPLAADFHRLFLGPALNDGVAHG